MNTNLKTSWDKSLLFSLLALIGIGLVQVYSASFILAGETYNDPFYFIRKQVIFAIIGLAALMVGFLVPWRYYEKWGLFFWFATIGAILLTLIPGIGVKVGGAKRWLNLGFGLRLEPGELMKLTFPFFFAWYWKKYKEFTRAHHIVALGFFFIPLLILFFQPDFGTFMIISMVGVLLLFISGLHYKYFISAIVAAIPFLYFAVMKVPYRRARVLAFMNPWKDSEENGFQLLQSLMSFKSGGIFGEGLGLSQGKLYFLPEAHTDFIMSVFAEESGFIGVFLLMLLYGFIIIKGFRIALHTKESYSRWVALGFVITFSLSVVINIGVVLGMLPTKGLTLPLVSYGGTSLIAFCWGFGLLLNINRESASEKEHASILHN